ncbi:MAG: hypothetical protein JWM87_1190 [Candidatus Eremiobacteraeota bacterium]|nr:hypothetical protein [Candidatus Eremiobacteraeota bacterium]
MNKLVRNVPAAMLAALTIAAVSAMPASAATPTACTLVDASHASALLGRSVTTVDRPSPISNGSSICMYMGAGRPVMQLAVTVMQTAGVAQANYAAQQRMAATHKNVGSRQKGNLVIAAIAMGGDSSKLNALLDAAVKNAP